MAISVNTYTAQDKKLFIDLHRKIFDSDMNEEYFSWKYERFPNADRPQIVVAKDGSDLVGAVGALYAPFVLNDQPISASHPMDIMVKNEYRSHKLFINLVNKLRELYDDIAFEFGTGVQETQIAWERFGGWDFKYVNKYIRLQHPEDLLHENRGLLLSILTLLAGGSFRLILRLYDRISNIKPDSWSVSKAVGYNGSSFDYSEKWSPYPLSIRRDQDYWMWRVSEPDLDTYTYWVEESEKPIASVLVAITKDSRRKKVNISLQDRINDEKGLSALILIYYHIIRNHRDATTISTINNSVDDICKTTGLNHNIWVKKFKDADIFNKITNYTNILNNINEIDRKPVGYKWVDGDMKEINRYEPSSWEYSKLITD